MTDSQKRFLHLCVVEQITYDEISEILDVPKSTLTTWYELLRQEREEIAAIRRLWTRKNRPGTSFSHFYDWYLHQDRKCHYCGITEQEIGELLTREKLKTKRLSTRGRKLELERRNPVLPYSDLGNLTLCCYWCNNAKTDTFTDEEFNRVGAVFKSIWKDRLEK